MIGIAVIGAGRWGPNLIANFEAAPRSRVCWVVDANPKRREAVARRFPGVRVGASLEPVLEDPSVDAVVIATPTRTHGDLASRVLRAGRHVLVEKPLAHDLATAERLREEAARHRRILMVGHVFLFNDACRHVKSVLEAGDLGRLFYLSMIRTNLGPIRVDVDAAWDLAAHDVSLANDWLASEPLAVSATGGAWINPGIADVAFATFRYPDDVLVHLHASWLHPKKSRDITIVGERKMLRFDDLDLDAPVKIHDKQVLDDLESAPLVDSIASFRMSVREGDVLTPRIPRSEPLRNECLHFLDCVESGSPPESGPAEGVAVVRALEALSRSLSEGGAVVEVTRT